MSSRYPGGIITKTPVVPTGPAEDGTAPGIWTLEQQLQFQKTGIWPTAGVKGPDAYIENLFSTYLYTGNGSTQTITNGIDLSGKGGLVWAKCRTKNEQHGLYDTARGAYQWMPSNGTNASTNFNPGGVSAFNSNGFTVFDNSFGSYAINGSSEAQTYASWTFREQPKFFDIVTWTGSNDSGTNIGKGIVSHNLGSAPGCVIVKNVTQGATNWIVYHRSLSGGYRVVLNTTDAQTNAGSSGYFSKYTDGVGWVQTDPDANNIYVGFNYQTNGVGDTIVAYLFAHNAGGFGLTGTDNVISCGSYTGNGSATGPVVDLGYEPQWVMVKQSSASGQWWNMIDVMRGFDVSTGAQTLGANASDAELTNAGFGSGTPIMSPTATGFQVRSAQPATNASGATYIYIAIRRGPMKVPTSGTSVFAPVLRTGTNAAATVTTGNLPDWVLIKGRTSGTDGNNYSRLTGQNRQLYTNSTLQEINQGSGYGVTAFLNTAFTLGQNANGENANGASLVNYAFSRAPGFFDEVCYTGTGSAKSVPHNLGAVPELVIWKERSTTSDWYVYQGTANSRTYGRLNTTANFAGNSPGWFSSVTSTQIGVCASSDNTDVNDNGVTYVQYLFATVAGVSKVGLYTGTGTTQTINCGFTAGSRFILIKRLDDAGDWYVWDSARGIVAGNDPYLLLNSSAAEVTGTDYVDTASSGFEISSTAPAAINANGGSFIFLSIA